MRTTRCFFLNKLISINEQEYAFCESRLWEMKRNFKLVMAYDGTDFHGWQIQPDRPTIQGILSEAIFRITAERTLPQGSGRTDAGVHALGQVASFALESSIPTRNLHVALNDKLPPSVRALALDEVPMDFHARHSARAKSYEYRIFRGAVCPPFLARYAHHYPYPLDEDAVIAAAEMVLGEHDFTSFAAVDPERGKEEPEPSNVRTIYQSKFRRDGDLLIYSVRGNGFLHHMVRNLVGTFLLAGKGMVVPSSIPEILAARRRSAAGPTAPASGLFLVSVEY